MPGSHSSVVSFMHLESRGREEMTRRWERPGAGALTDPVPPWGWSHLGSLAFRVCESTLWARLAEGREELFTKEVACSAVLTCCDLPT